MTTLGGIYAWGVMQDALYELEVAPSSTLAFIGSTQVSRSCLLRHGQLRLIRSSLCRLLLRLYLLCPSLA